MKLKVKLIKSNYSKEKTLELNWRNNMIFLLRFQ